MIYREKLRSFKSLKEQDSSIWTEGIPKDEFRANVGTASDFILKYEREETVKESEHFRITRYKLRNDIDGTGGAFIVKKFAYKQGDNQSEEEVAMLLRTWIVMKKLGPIEQCEIYHDDKYYYNVRLVQKLWNTDLFKYTVYHLDDNMFKDMSNIALLLKDIIGQLKKTA